MLETETDSALLEVARTFRPAYWRKATASSPLVGYRKT